MLFKIANRNGPLKHQQRRVGRGPGQIYSYLIVIDFESTCWQDSRSKNQEIIEFPAVLLNTNTGEIESEFHYYVQPHENPILSDFCKKLTGITQEQVERGIPLSICLKKFSHWLKKISEERGFFYNNADDKVNKRCTFVTWSDWDLGVCLKYEIQRKQLKRPPELNSWIDLRATYRKFYDRRPNGLNGALQDLGITFEGREHSGIIDSRNTAILANRMMCDGCIMTITKSIAGPVPTASIGQNFMLRPVTTPAAAKHSATDNIPISLRKSDAFSENTDTIRNICDNDVKQGEKKSETLPNMENQNCGKSSENVHKLDHRNNEIASSTDTQKTTSLVNSSSPIQRNIASDCDRMVQSLGGLRSNNCSSKTTVLTNESCKKLKSSSSVVQAVISKNTSTFNVCNTKRKGFSFEGKLSVKSNIEISCASNDGVQYKHCLNSNQEVVGSSSAKSLSIEENIKSTKLEQKFITKKIENPDYTKSSNLSRQTSHVVQTNICENNPMQSKRSLSEKNNQSSQFKTPHPVQNNCIKKYNHFSPTQNNSLYNLKSPSPNSSSSINKFKTPSPVHNGFENTTHQTSVQTNLLSGFTMKKSNSENVFKTPSPVQAFNVKQKAPSLLQSNIRANNSWSSNSDLSYTTPSPNQSSSFNHGFMNESITKRTPPMCDCGRRTCRKIVQSPGPNVGRAFFCCPRGRKGSTGKKSGCGFFKWEPSCNNSFMNTSHSRFNSGSSVFTSGSSIIISPPFKENEISIHNTSSLPQPNFSTPSNSEKANCEKQNKSGVNVWETEMNNVNLSDFDSSF